MAADYGTAVFGRIFPHRLTELEYAEDRLTLDHFHDGIHRTLWKCLTDYWASYREIFPSGYLTDLLQRAGVAQEQVLVLSNTYDGYVDAEVSEGEFRAAVDFLRDALDTRQTGEAITVAYDILERGVEVDGELRSGHRDARSYFQTKVAEIDDREATEEAPEGDIRTEAERLIDLYESAGQEASTGVEFGVETLDQSLNGLQAGELALIAGYAAAGKSQSCAQLAWRTAVEQQRGVFFATTETGRDTTIRRILSRHSRLPKFGLPDGLNAKEIQRGSLSDREKQVYFDVIEDFAKTSAICHISQLPANPTVDFVASRAARVNRTSQLDLIIIDYLQLLTVPPPSRGEREDYNQILRSSKRLAASFDSGRGVAVVSPWQIKRAAFDTALEVGRYEMGSLADTAEADRSPDVVLSILLSGGDGHRTAKMQILKHRDGPGLDPFDVEVDYRTSFLGTPGTLTPVTSRPSARSLDLDALQNSLLGGQL